MQDKAKTAELLQQSEMAVQLAQSIIQQLLNQHPTTPNLDTAYGSPQQAPVAHNNNNPYLMATNPAPTPVGYSQPMATPPVVPNYIRGGF
jgi:hypothetical protein